VYWYLKLVFRALPEAGVTETAVGGLLIAEVVHVPRVIQPVLRPARSSADIETGSDPENPVWRVMERVSVSTLPETDTELPLPLRMHWLF
jgi:hypothetical protein